MVYLIRRSIYIHILFASILQPHPPTAMRNALPPPHILSCNRILSGFFFSCSTLSLTSSLSTHSLYYSAQLQRGKRGIGSFRGIALDGGRKKRVFSSSLGCEIASQLQRRSHRAIRRICSLVSALSLNFTECVWFACDNLLLERSDCLVT